MTLELVREMAEREGIDLDALDTENEAEQERMNYPAASRGVSK